MKKILFIDRDGTIIIEPKDEQIDSLEKLEFYPKVISNLNKIANETDFEFVMVSNQDGLGTSSFPDKDFLPAHKKMLKTLENEGIIFSEILIDRSFPKDNSPNRKPKIGMFKKYIAGEYDLQNSFVIGDRESDIQLAKNLGCEAIYINKQKNKKSILSTTDWNDIYNFLTSLERKIKLIRKTNETNISIEINLDGKGNYKIDTGIGFLDHMLELFSKHSNIDIVLDAKGDLEVDKHHTVEDIGLILGEAINKILGDKKGIERYGFLLPMDDSLAQVALDFSDRPFFIWNAEFKREKIGEMPTELFEHFFQSFTNSAKCNLNIKVDGKNEHHKIEAIFKAVARSIKTAISRKDGNKQIPSTKGIL
ncbi:MAG: bifunctional histidinol-phosphatase/imidazoleglycerol-phosphate dehydratase HisB [Candidatus Marinimicrobia bacterium]|nr:bifunctional histidinol-phosphatase/imidazoleglycerol-phosphate dehydratase HisB [Candidatus Neomarinimicrobiota bacterium]